MVVEVSGCINYRDEKTCWLNRRHTLRAVLKASTIMVICEKANLWLALIFFYNVVSLLDVADYEKMVFGSPWIISDHCLTVQKWYQDFEAKTTSISKMAAWIKCLIYPMSILRRIHWLNLWMLWTCSSDRWNYPE